jgi:lipopolysaccharide/colanic/teichoic acid biosynthesis glycosyltransferase
MRFTRHEPILLFIGDLVVLYVSLWLTLFLRYFKLPSYELWTMHAVPFTLLFVVSVLVYFITGLYDQHTVLVRERMPVLVTIGQFVSVVVAAIFFLLVPYFGITPKTNLAIFLLVSSILMVGWRLLWARVPGIGKQSNALVLGQGKELDQLVREIETNPRYGLRIVSHTMPADIVLSKEHEEQLLTYLSRKNVSVIIAETRDKHMNEIVRVLYNLLFVRTNLTLVDAMRLYETIFRRIPISMLEDTWFIEHITRTSYLVHRVFQRTVDLVVGVLVGAVWLLVTPFVWLAIKLEDGGSLYVEQIRVGQHDRPLRIKKFRSMTGSDTGDNVLNSTLTVTKVGHVMRVTRIDELPQCLNLLKGDLSFIGPRPELPALAKVYAEQIPYYSARHLIKSGLTGWAQLYHDQHPHHGTDVDETRNKLSYDLYYLKHRSILLDIEIALKTIKKIITRSGA